MGGRSMLLGMVGGYYGLYDCPTRDGGGFYRM